MKTRFWIVGLIVSVLIFFGSSYAANAYWLTKVKNWLIMDSQIENTPIGGVTPNTGAFTNLSGDVITGVKYLETQVTETLYVDGNRTDSYTENGSITKPFKTIQAAIAAASGDVLINVAPGTYAGDIDLGLNVVSIRGSGINATHFTGNLTAGDRAHSLEEFRIKTTGSLTITDNIFARNLHLQCAVTVSGTGFLEGQGVYMAPGSGVVPLTITSTSGAVLFRSSIVAQGDVNAINQTAGTLVVFHSYAANSSLTATTIDSSGGVCGLVDTSVYNTGFGAAVGLDNDGAALTPNTLEGVVCAGNIACAAAKTYVEGLNFIGFGALSGTVLVFQPASRVSFDKSISGLTATTVQAAIDEVYSLLP